MSAARDELIQYCMRKLGAPLLTINVSPEQMSDCVDDSLQAYTNYHYNGMERMWMKFVVTQADIDNKFITLPRKIKSVVKVLPFNFSGSASMSAAQFAPKYQFIANEIFNLNSQGSLISYELAMQNLNLVESFFGEFPAVGFTSNQKQLKLAMDWTRFVADETIIVIECHAAIDPEEFTDIYDESWIKKNTAALIKKQWGNNLKKFQGVALPGGITLDGKTIYDEAVEELSQLKEDLLLQQLPTDFFCG